MNEPTRQQKWQEKMKAAGRCVTCGGRLAPTSVMRCRKHLKSRRIYQREWDRLRKAS